MQLVGAIYAPKYIPCHPEILPSVTLLYKLLKVLTKKTIELGCFDWNGPAGLLSLFPKTLKKYCLFKDHALFTPDLQGW